MPRTSEPEEPPAEPLEPAWLWVIEAMQVMCRLPHQMDWAERFAARVEQPSALVRAGLLSAKGAARQPFGRVQGGLP